jgi:Ca-activated chloride channel homolog
MSISRLFRSPRARRGIAASAIVLSLGGLVLFHAPAGAETQPVFVDESFVNGTTFTGPGASGSFSLSHGKVLADGRQRVFAELRLRADKGDIAVERAPLAMVIALDTSGSMEGDKLEQAKRNVIRMLSQMRPEDEVAFVRYDSGAELVQPMARVAGVRSALIERVQMFTSTGGTNIPSALRLGMQAMAGASSGRVKRLVLVSDGLDSTRSEAEAIARSGTDLGTTVSALGIGLDFDESYLSSVALAGRGNFGFVQNASSLEKFLARELTEASTTSVERAVAHIRLPQHMRFRRAVGADVRQLGRGELELRIGSLFAGDERRVVLELDVDAPLGTDLPVDAQIAWQPVGDDATSLDLEQLRLATTDSEAAMKAARDGQVWASGVSAMASLRQMEATQAYAKGDLGRARSLMSENKDELEEAAQAAPPSAAAGLRAQSDGYGKQRRDFENADPSSAEGRAAAKQAAEADSKNLDRPSW